MQDVITAGRLRQMYRLPSAGLTEVPGLSFSSFCREDRLSLGKCVRSWDVIQSRLN